MPMKIMYRLLAVIICSIALIQWYGIGERISHGLWQWYKFYGYSSNAYTTVGETSLLITSIATVITLTFCVFVYKFSEDKFTKLAVKLSSYSLTLGYFSLIILLISPIGFLVQR